VNKLMYVNLEYYDVNSKEIKWGEIDFIEKHLVNKNMFFIVLNNGLNVKVTEDHSLMVLRDNNIIKTKVCDLNKDDIFITINGNTTYKEIIPLIDTNPQLVFDIQMKDNPHTFFANGILVHNSTMLIDIKDNFSQVLNKFNNEGVKNLIKEYNPNVLEQFIRYDLEYESDVEYGYFSDRKKRYYLILKDGSKIIHGINIIKKDTPRLIKKLLDNLCESSIKGEIKYEMLENAFNEIKNAEYPEIAVHKFISKPFSWYDKLVPQHVTGAMFANDIFDLNILHSDVVFLFYVINKCELDKKPNQRRTSLCLREEDFHILKESDKVEIDYLELFEKQILQPLREFGLIIDVTIAINAWCKNHSDTYKLNRKNEYSFKKRHIK